MSERRLTIFVAHCSDLLTDHRPHGDGLIAAGFIRHLAERGHSLHVAVQNADLLTPFPNDVTLHKITPRFSGIVGRLEYMLRLRRLFNDLRRGIKFDLIHQLNPVFVGISLGLAGSGIPIVLGTFVARWPDLRKNNAFISTDAFKEFAAKVVRSAISALQQSQASALLLTTPAAKNRIPFTKQLTGRIHYLPHGVDTTLFKPAEESTSERALAEEQLRPSILFLANVWRRKGIFTLLEAFAKVSAAVPACRLTIAGDGADLAQVKSLASTMTCSGFIDFLGHVNRTDAVNLYQKATVYCLPSLGEPYATTVLEAMSCGRALVVTDAGGLPYMAGDEGSAIVPVEDPATLASALISLLNSPERRAAMGEANRTRILKTMTWDSVAKQLESVYEQVLAEKGTKTIRSASTTHVGIHKREALGSPDGGLNL